MKIHVIYHRSDFDGIFCREIAKKFLSQEDTIFYGIEHGDPIPPIPKEDRLYIMDFSVPELMDHPNLVWIDHHKTAIEKFGRKPGLQVEGVAACRLAWQWFTHEPQRPTDSGKGATVVPLPSKEAFVDRKVVEPFAVRLAGEYDIWDKRDPNAELFQHGLRSRELGPDTWDILLSGPTEPDAGGRQGLAELYVETLLDAGEAVQYAKTKENESIARHQSFTLKWEGITFIACNAARFNSHLFTAALEDQHEGCLGFCWNGKMKIWKVSLYGVPGKPDIDLSLIAMKYGGGGHKQACGFECETLPFPL